MRTISRSEVLSPALSLAGHSGCNYPSEQQHQYRATPELSDGSLTVDPEIELFGYGLNLSISLYYSNKVSSSTAWGKSRNSSVNSRLLVPELGSTYAINRGDFTQPQFTLVGSSGGVTTFTAVAVSGSLTTLTRNDASGVYTEHFSDGTKINYKEQVSASGICPILTVETSSGFRHTYNYGSGGEAGLLTSIDIGPSQRVTFAYAAFGGVTLVNSVTDFASSPRKWTLQYDSTQRLTTFQTPLGCITKYTYDGDLITAIEDPRGFVTSYVYTSGAVTGMQLGSATWTYAYDAPNSRTMVTQPSGAVTTYNYVSSGLKLF